MISKLRIAGIVIIAIIVASSTWWGPQAMSHLSFFRLKRVQVHGLSYLSEAEFMKQLGVDTTMSVWMDLRPLEKRMREHPQLLSVTFSRKLPGTLVIRVVERQPLALVPGGKGGGLVAIDDSGSTIPVDPSSGTVNAPILPSADTALVRFLSEIRNEDPTLYRRINTITRVGKDEIRIELMNLPVLAMSDITIRRLLDILPVERDLALKGIQVAELDLRYAGQVIARQIRNK